jgi:hypothetical protein
MMILTVTILPDGRSTAPFEVDTGSIVEDQGQFAEQVTAAMEEAFFDLILDALRSERGRTILLIVS